MSIICWLFPGANARYCVSSYTMFSTMVNVQKTASVLLVGVVELCRYFQSFVVPQQEKLTTIGCRVVVCKSMTRSLGWRKERWRERYVVYLLITMMMTQRAGFRPRQDAWQKRLIKGDQALFPMTMPCASILSRLCWYISCVVLTLG